MSLLARDDDDGARVLDGSRMSHVSRMGRTGGGLMSRASRVAAPKSDAPRSPVNMPPAERSPRQRTIEIVLFLTLFVAYGYFNQGGGWNQNGRFDQVRAIVERGQLFING